MKLNNNKKILFLTAGVAIVFMFTVGLVRNFNNQQIATAPESNLAQTNYVPLSGDEVFTSDTPNFGEFMETAFMWIIVVIIVLAVLFIVLGGIQYMTTDSVFEKKEGLTKVQSAIAGLILALVSWLILNTINPDLLKTDPTRAINTSTTQ